MSAHNATAAADDPRDFFTRHHFLLRRLHSLSGIVPIGIFVCFHLFTNMQMMLGTFQHEVDWIHSQPALLFAEIGILWLPLAFHAGLGFWYAFTGRGNTGQYRYAANWRYSMQRWTGYLAFLFIFWHVATLRWRWDFFGFYTPFFTHALTPEGQVIPFAHQATAIAMQSGFYIVAVAYLIGVYSAVFHFANGLWTAAITWGLTLTVAAQKRWGYVCLLVGVTLGLFSAGSFVGALGYRVSDHERQSYQLTQQLFREHGVLLHKEDLVHPSATVADGQIRLLTAGTP